MPSDLGSEFYGGYHMLFMWVPYSSHRFCEVHESLVPYDMTHIVSMRFLDFMGSIRYGSSLQISLRWGQYFIDLINTTNKQTNKIT